MPKKTGQTTPGAGLAPPASGIGAQRVTNGRAATVPQAVTPLGLHRQGPAALQPKTPVVASQKSQHGGAQIEPTQVDQVSRQQSKHHPTQQQHQPQDQPKPQLQQQQQQQSQQQQVPRSTKRPEVAHRDAPAPKKPRVQREPLGSGLASALTLMRAELGPLHDVDGVSELVETFPEVVLLGGPASRHEILAAFLGGSLNATDVAGMVLPSGTRQPFALEIRFPDDAPAVDLENLVPAKASEFLAQLQKATKNGVGPRLKVDPLRLRLTVMDSVNMDIVDLPEQVFDMDDSTMATPEVAEMRQRYLASSSNILVCLEDSFAEVCRRYDPRSQRTVRVGAASMPMLTVEDAVEQLEERFVKRLESHAPQWMAALGRLESRLTKVRTETRELVQAESVDDIVARARQVGISFGRGLREVVKGTAGSKYAATLEDELKLFATDAARSTRTDGFSLDGGEVATAASDLFGSFGGVSGYADYLKEVVKISGAEVPLDGGAAWNRLLAEIEVAMRLAHPPEEALQMLVLSAIRCGGTGVHGHQRWEDISSKLMLSVSFEPLRNRVRYIAARVLWMLRKQKTTIVEWMATVAEGPGGRYFSHLFPEHLQVLRGNPVCRDLVFEAYNKASARVAEQVLKDMLSTLTAGCINPDLVLRPTTEPDMDPKSLNEPERQQTKSDRTAESKKRVMGEMATRERQDGEEPVADQNDTHVPSKSDVVKEVAVGNDTNVSEDIPVGAASTENVAVATSAQEEQAGSLVMRGGLPVQLCDKVFEPMDAQCAVPHVEVLLRRAFLVLTKVLASQAYSFADNAMSGLCRRELDEAVSAIDFEPEQRRVMTERHTELQDRVRQVEKRLDAVNRCSSALQAQIRN